MKWAGLGKPLNLPNLLSRGADPAGGRGAKLHGGCKAEREPLRSARRDVPRRLRNLPQLWWRGGEACFEPSPNDFSAFGPETNSCFCASFRGSGESPPRLHQSMQRTGLLVLQGLFTPRPFTPRALMAPELPVAWGDHRHMLAPSRNPFTGSLSVEKKKGKPTQIIFILRWYGFVQTDTLHTSF